MKKRKAIALILSFLMVFTLLPSTVFAQTSKEETPEPTIFSKDGATSDFIYVGDGFNIYFDTSTGTITDCDVASQSVNIPAKINGQDVTNIGRYAFHKCGNLKEISIPSSVTRIERYAFSECIQLSDVALPENLEYLGAGAFFKCTYLRSVYIPKSLTGVGREYRDFIYWYEVGAFEGCINLENVSFEKGISEIPDNLFSECEGIVDISIPDSVTKIGQYAFYKCVNLKEVSVPNGVTEIGMEAFNGCANLKEISLPGSVTRIERHAFSECIQLPDVVLPENLEYLGAGAFFKCTGLRSVYIPKSLTGVGREYRDFIYWYEVGAFEGCINLENVSFEKGISEIPDNLFSECEGIVDISVPNSVTKIGQYAFYKCANLKEVTIPSSVTRIEKHAFSECIQLPDVVLPENLEYLGAGAFFKCTGLRSVYIPKSLVNVSRMYRNDLLQSYYIGAFEGCENLGNVSFEKGISEIPDNLFSECEGIVDISIPDSVTKIGQYAFYKCANLKEVTIPSSVTRIEKHAFSECIQLPDVVLPENLEYLGAGAFFECTALRSVYIPKSLVNVSRMYMNDLFQSYYIGAFEGCENLGNVSFEKGISEIPDNLFSECEGIVDISIPDSVTKIGQYAFYKCVNLKGITIPSSVTAIGESAFDFCDSLTIYGYTNSYAEQYAAEQDINFVVIGESSDNDETNLAFNGSAAEKDEFIHMLVAQFSYLNVNNHIASTVKDALIENPTASAFDERSKVWQNEEIQYKDIFDGFIGDWKIIKAERNPNSGFGAVAIKKGDDIIIGYRGSESNDDMFNDWIKTNMAFVIGNRLSKQFDDAVTFYKELKNENPGSKITLSGHSLGGALVSHVSTVTGAKGFSFDGAVGHTIDVSYFYDADIIDRFQGTDKMNFTNYTDSEGYAGADIIQHTNSDYIYGVDRETSEQLVQYSNDPAWKKQFYSHYAFSTLNINDNEISFNKVMNRHEPKNNWKLQLNTNPLEIIVSAWLDNVVLDAIKPSTLMGVSLGTSGDDNIKADLYLSKYYSATTLYGGDGADRVSSYANNDTIVAGRGNDKVLKGGIGADTYIIDVDTNSVIIDDISGSNRIYFRGYGLDSSKEIKQVRSDDGYTSFEVGNTKVKVKERLFSSFNIYGLDNGKSIHIAKGSDVSKGNLREYKKVENTLNRVVREKGYYRSGANKEDLAKCFIINGISTVKIFDEQGNLVDTVDNKISKEIAENRYTVDAVNNDTEQYIIVQINSGNYDLRVMSESTIDLDLIKFDENDSINSISSVESVNLNSRVLKVNTESDRKVQIENESGDVSNELKMEVTNAIDDIAIKSSKSKIRAGDAVTMNIELKGSLSNKEKVVVLSDNEEKVTVKELRNGKVKVIGKKAGRVKIIAVGQISGITKSKTIKVTAIPKAAMFKATAGNKKMNLSWKKISKVTGYEITYANNKAFTKSKKVVNVKKTSKSIKKLKKGKIYYVKMRAYKMVEGEKIYGKYTNTKRVKIK